MAETRRSWRGLPECRDDRCALISRSDRLRTWCRTFPRLVQPMLGKTALRESSALDSGAASGHSLRRPWHMYWLSSDRSSIC